MTLGGTFEISLPPSTELVTATGKESAELWYLHCPMRAGESPEVLTLQQEKGSPLRIAGDGKIVFRESK